MRKRNIQRIHEGLIAKCHVNSICNIVEVAWCIMKFLIDI